MLIAYFILLLLVLLLVVAALLPKVYHIEKSVIIKQPVAAVMGKVSDFNFYAAWNPWQQMDPAAHVWITGQPKTPGHKYEWRGKKTGTGQMLLTTIDDKHIRLDVLFFKPWKSRATENWFFEPWSDGSETKVTWQNNGNLPYPLGRLLGPVIHKNLNHRFETGLNNLKKLCEG